MSADIESIVLEKMCIRGKCALQLDESRDISGCAQLLANVGFVDGAVIRENFLFCKALPEKQQERKYFRSHQNILSKEDLREKTASVCTDGAATMVGHMKGSLAV